MKDAVPRLPASVLHDNNATQAPGDVLVPLMVSKVQMMVESGASFTHAFVLMHAVIRLIDR